jgi:hypothetical protein
MICRNDLSVSLRMRVYSLNNWLNSLTTDSLSKPRLFSKLACLASWLILLPERPNSPPIVSSVISRFCEFIINVPEFSSTRFLIISERESPSCFSKLTSCFSSSSVRRISNRLVLPLGFCLLFIQKEFDLRSQWIRLARIILWAYKKPSCAGFSSLAGRGPAKASCFCSASETCTYKNTTCRLKNKRAAVYTAISILSLV